MSSTASCASNFTASKPCSAAQNRELQPIAEFTVALPVQGFMQALGVLESVRQRFVEQGLIPPPGAPEGGPPPPPAKSPNFS